MLCIKNDKVYALAQLVSDKEFPEIRIVKNKRLGNWNYTVCSIWNKSLKLNNNFAQA
jgi:hypothetical protein